MSRIVFSKQGGGGAHIQRLTLPDLEWLSQGRDSLTRAKHLPNNMYERFHGSVVRHEVIITCMNREKRTISVSVQTYI